WDTPSAKMCRRCQKASTAGAVPGSASVRAQRRPRHSIFLPMTPKFIDGPIPRYVQLADLMRQRIARGIWPEGHQLPSLEELVAEFGVARATVRHGIGLLADEGLVARRQGQGTFVTGRPQNDRWIKVVTSLAELAKSYEDTRPTIVNI